MGGRERGSVTSDNSTDSGCLGLFPEHPDHCEVIVTVKRVVASISIIGCLFVIFVIWLYKKYLILTQRLILFLTIAALVHSIAAMGSLQEQDGPVCALEGWWINFSLCFILMWVGCITFNMFMNAVKLKKTDKYEWIYHLLSWGISIIISSIPLIGNPDHYEPAGFWCWLDDWEWRLGIWYIPKFAMLFVLIAVNLYITVHVFRNVKTWEGKYDPDVEHTKQVLKQDVKPLRAYPLVFLLLDILPLINRIQNAVDPDHPIFALYILQSVFTPLQGAVNAVIFGMDKETVSRLSIAQIKATLLSRFSSPTTIHEYPVEPSQEDRNPESGQQHA